MTRRTDSRFLPPTRSALFIYDVRAKRARCVNPATGDFVVGFVGTEFEIHPADVASVLATLGPGFEVRSRLVSADIRRPSRKG